MLTHPHEMRRARCRPSNLARRGWLGASPGARGRSPGGRIAPNWFVCSSRRGRLRCFCRQSFCHDHTPTQSGPFLREYDLRKKLKNSERTFSIFSTRYFLAYLLAYLLLEMTDKTPHNAAKVINNLPNDIFSKVPRGGPTTIFGS